MNLMAKMLVSLSLRVHVVSSFIILGELVTAQLVVPEIFINFQGP